MNKIIFVCCFLIAAFVVNAQTEQVVEVKPAMTQAEIDDKIFTKVEIESTFPGGDKAWHSYILSNIRYPKKAVKKKIQGTVMLQFMVSKEGKVSDIHVFRSVDPLLDEEAIRLIKNSPDWIPAVQNGRKVNSIKRQSINFKLTS